jgi:hypothetical protein
MTQLGTPYFKFDNKESNTMAAEDHKQEAAEKANRAGRQFKHAASNAADAAEASAHVAKDEIVEHGEEAAEKAKNVIAALVNAEYTQAALAIGLGAMSVAIGVKKIQNARRISNRIRENTARAR